MPQSATVRLNNLIIYGYHGVLAEEKTLGQRFELDVEFRYSCAQAVQSDLLKDTISYVDIYELVANVVGQMRFKLLETLAAYLIEAIRQRFEVTFVAIRIRKPAVPLPGVLDHVEVELDWTAPAEPAEEAP